VSGITVIGLGGMARALGARAVEGGNAVEVVGRGPDKAEDLAAALGGGAAAGTFGTAPAGDIVILAVPNASAVPVVAQYGKALAGTVIASVSAFVESLGCAPWMPDAWRWRTGWKGRVCPS
jgi:8-hydroxy-5-deazaflavin:NADPH oxidoreductase